MFEEPDDENPEQRKTDPATRARDKSDEFRMHAELAAVFEGGRKYDAQLLANLDAGAAREIQRTIGQLDKARTPDHPILPTPEAMTQAALLLGYMEPPELSTNDYHIHRRPGEVMIMRWLAGEQVETFYTRMQAHFDAAIEGFREDEHQALAWRGDPDTAAYLAALDAIKIDMAERYLRGPIKEHSLFVLSTQAADEMNIMHLCETIMGVPPADVVGQNSAPPEDGPTEQDLAWYFKLYCVRGSLEGVERMCFFAYLQKTEESW